MTYIAEKSNIRELNTSLGAVEGTPADIATNLVKCTVSRKLVSCTIRHLHQRHWKFSLNIYINDFIAQPLQAELQLTVIVVFGT